MYICSGCDTVDGSADTSDGVSVALLGDSELVVMANESLLIDFGDSGRSLTISADGREVGSC